MSNFNSNNPNQPDKPICPEPVRSRWTPKPEQILILESIFNSGMVNPPKDETVRIRKLLENFGAVGDANVFYWFQNRRSRSRRRQRLMQAGLAGEQPRLGGGEPSTSNSSVGSGGFASVPVCAGAIAGTPGYGGGGVDDGGDDLFAISRQMGFPEVGVGSSFSPELHYQSGLITVFINGIATDVSQGPIDMRAMFGNDVLLVHSSGEVVPTTDRGILLHGLQMGENYFLVSKSIS